MDKRTLIALAIAFLVLGFYPVVLEKFYPGYMKKTQAVSQKTVQTSTALPPTPSVEKTPGALSDSEDLRFKSEKLVLLFNKKGGAIREVSLPAFTNSETRSPITLFSSASQESLSTSLKVSGRPLADYSLEARDHSILAQTVLDGMRISKTYEFREKGYDGDLKIHFENLSDQPIKFRYELSAGSSFEPRHSIDTQYIEANFYSTAGGKAELRHLKEGKRGKRIESAVPIQWVATKDRHFSLIVKPMTEVPFTGLVEGLGEHAFVVSVVSPEIELSGGSSVEHHFLVYAGPSEIEKLVPLNLDPIVSFGKLDAIGKLCVGALELIYKICRNYGIAIILLTILINILLFPLTRASYMSMKRMQVVQPQMNRLREQHKKSPEKLNKEMMELYKKHKVNPFGGCLPMVLQMPVFMALYVALSKATILVNSKLLWIKDLSSPDSVALPLSLPFLGDQIHVLPLIMVGAMFFQQRFTQVQMAGQDPAMQAQQKMMAVMMPIIFGFIFYTMPSGLVLYWLTNTVLMTLYQLRLKKMTLT